MGGLPKGNEWEPCHSLFPGNSPKDLEQNESRWMNMKCLAAEDKVGHWYYCQKPWPLAKQDIHETNHSQPLLPCPAILCPQEQALPANNPSRRVLQCCVRRARSKRRHAEREEKPAKQKDVALKQDTRQPFPAGSRSWSKHEGKVKTFCIDHEQKKETALGPGQLCLARVL